MTSSPPTPLPDTDKLTALRELDQFREWRSLDDERYCLVCRKVITGRQIQVTCTLGNDPVRLNCPTEECNSIPMDWVLVTDEILALTKAASPKERSVTPPRAVDHAEAQDPTLQLSNFMAHLKQAS